MPRKSPDKLNSSLVFLEFSFQDLADAYERLSMAIKSIGAPLTEEQRQSILNQQSEEIFNEFLAIAASIFIVLTLILLVI